MAGESSASERRVRSVEKPTDLVAVDAASAAAIAEAPFDAAAIADREVSYMTLIDADVPPKVANQLRRAYSLVWSFTWRPGADLSRRAETVSGLREDQSAWIEASISDNSTFQDGATAESTDGMPVTDHEDTESTGDEDAAVSRTKCPRCGEPLVVYSLGAMEQRACEACGFADVERQ